MKRHKKKPRSDAPRPGDSHRIQTCNLLIRSQMLYSVELANHDLVYFDAAKVRTFFEFTKFSSDFFNDSFFTRFQGTILEIRKPAGLRTVKESSLQIGKASFFLQTLQRTHYIIKQEINNSTGSCF